MANPYLTDRLPETLPSDPMHWVEAWIKDAQEQDVARNPNAMAIVTANAEGAPSVRMVLCKALDADAGNLVFYTNYRSTKSREIDANTNVAALFHWDALGRQVRIQGTAVRTPAAESDDYFATRNWGSQLGAWGSDQSQPLESRQALIKQVGKRALKMGVNVAKNLQSIIGDDQPVIERPPHWGGIRIWARSVELWVEGKDRIHDRARWERELVHTNDGDFETGAWSGTRLQP
ncbi:MAG: pyridoxamine 5'-phosphate oxidase [Pseudomonadota bacterium]